MCDNLELNESKILCPYCKNYSGEPWKSVTISNDGNLLLNIIPINGFGDRIEVSKCRRCEEIQVWLNEEMIIPAVVGIPEANKYMPSKVKEIYDEARNVFPKSVKASAALLRLAIQHLCKDIGGEGQTLDKAIGDLVKKGVSTEVQQALDIVRVIGNNAVHPGTINLEDNKDVALRLFELLNFVVEREIAEPKKTDEMFNKLPDNVLESIKNRDKSK
ncbi:MAG: DUF4145 domain-containing protein [Paeniclostridium sordellii]|nr:DUF4145 domain-containing protein [Paeniclostridium sordellii]